MVGFHNKNAEAFISFSLWVSEGRKNTGSHTGNRNECTNYLQLQELRGKGKSWRKNYAIQLSQPEFFPGMREKPLVKPSKLKSRRETL